MFRSCPPLPFYHKPQLRKSDCRCIRAVAGCITLSHNLPKERATTFCNHRYHVHLSVGVVVPHCTTKHRGYLWSSEGLLLSEGFFVHWEWFWYCVGNAIYWTGRGRLRLAEEGTDDRQDLGFCLIQVVVHHDVVELRREGHLIFGLGQAVLNGLRGVGAAAY